MLRKLSEAAWGGVWLALIIGLVVFSPLEALAGPLEGQGGGNNTSDNSLTLIIIIALIVVIAGAGVGLIMSRRKK